MPLFARDVMQTDVITVSPDEPLLGVQRLFVEEEIGGAPVVDDAGRVVGMIASVDVLRAVSEEHDSARMDSTYFRELLEFSGPDWIAGSEDFQDRLREMTASDAMTDGVVTVDVDAPVPAVARTMRENHIHRVLVVDQERLVGIVSTFDLVGLLEKEG